MTEELTGLASHNSNMVAPHEQSYEGGWTIYRTRKSRRALNKKKMKSLSFFDTYVDNSTEYDLFSASSSDSSTSTGTKTSYADIVKGTIHKSQPPVNIKTNISDDISINSEITEDHTIMKCTLQPHKPKFNQMVSVHTNIKDHHNHVKKTSNPRAAQPDVKTHISKVQESEFLDETSIGEIYIQSSRTEAQDKKVPRDKHDSSRKSSRKSDFEIAYSAKSSNIKYKNKDGFMTSSKDPPSTIRPINDNHVTLEQHKLQELCLREISHREKYINSKVLGNPYPKYTDQSIYRKTGERIDIISDVHSYTDEINRNLPTMSPVLFPVCSMEMSYHFSNFLSCEGIDWEPFGYERKIELRRIEGSAFYHQLRKLHCTHAWKEVYKKCK